MSVPVSQRGQSKMAVFVKAREVLKYTLEITSNSNKFDPTYQYLIDQINSTALKIPIFVQKANREKRNVNHNSSSPRAVYQNKAIKACEDLIDLVNIGAGIFHYTTNRWDHWVDMIEHEQSLIRLWKDSDH